MCPGKGGGGTLYDDLYGEAPPESGTFFRLLVYERVREICHSGLRNGPKGRTNEFYGFKKSEKRSSFVVDSYLNANASTAVERDAKF